MNHIWIEAIFIHWPTLSFSVWKHLLHLHLESVVVVNCQYDKPIREQKKKKKKHYLHLWWRKPHLQQSAYLCQSKQSGEEFSRVNTGGLLNQWWVSQPGRPDWSLQKKKKHGWNSILQTDETNMNFHLKMGGEEFGEVKEQLVIWSWEFICEARWG